MIKRSKETRMDEFLTSLGLWRKIIARESSLFRVVAEQVFLSQVEHVRVEKACRYYMRRNLSKFRKGAPAFLEIKAMSEVYNKDFVVYQEAHRPPLVVKAPHPNGQVVMCQKEPGHFDSVYPREYQKNAALCQSIIYEVLYDKVLGVEGSVDKAIEMLANTSRNAKDQTQEEPNKADRNGEASPTQTVTPETPQDQNGGLHSHDVSTERTFSFRVARSLHPSIYRNVEMDSWLYNRRSSAENVPLKSGFEVGDKCKVELPVAGNNPLSDSEQTEEETEEGTGEDEAQAEEGSGTEKTGSPSKTRHFNAHIQNLSAEKGPVTVFVEELGEMRTVPYESLVPVAQNLHKGHLFGGRRRSYRKRTDVPMMAPPVGGGVVGDGGVVDSNQGPDLPKTSNICTKKITFTPHLGARVRSSWSRGAGVNLSISGPREKRMDTLDDIPLVGSISVSPPSKPPFARDDASPFRERINHRDSMIVSREDSSRLPWERVEDFKEPVVLDLTKDFPALPTRNSPKDHKQQAWTTTGPSDMKSQGPPVSRENSKPSSPPHHYQQQRAPNGVPQPPVLTAPPPPPFMFPPPPPPPPPPATSAIGQVQLPPPPPPSLGQVPFCPYLIIPHIDSSTPINVNVTTSRDPTGKDLPQNDPATLRFFYNLGVEYYRLLAMFQMQQQQQYAAFINGQQMAMQAASSMNRNNQRPKQVEDDVNGQSKPKETPSDKTNDDVKTEAKVQADGLEESKVVDVKKDSEEEKQEQHEQRKSNKDASTNGHTEEKKAAEEKLPEKTELVVDLKNPQPEKDECEKGNSNAVESEKSNDSPHAGKGQCKYPSFDGTADSGCPSDVSSGNEGYSPAVECDMTIPPYIHDHHGDHSDSNHSNTPCDNHSDNQSDSSSQHSTSNLSLSSSGSDCGSFNLYNNTNNSYHHMTMRGRSSSGLPHKLLKPLKDIPPRFQKMLSCNPAIKQDQFEGQPIMRHSYHHHHNHKPKSVTVSANNLQELPSHHSFNPNAESFIPRQYISSPDNVPSPNNFSPNGLVSYDYSNHSSVPTDCCSIASSESMYSTASPTNTSVSPTNPGAPPGATPTYTIHIFSSNGSNVEATSYPYSYGNPGVYGPPSGFYGTNPALPAPPQHASNSYPVSHPAPSEAAQQAPPPPAPPGGIVYYNQPPNGYNQNYNCSSYNMPANGAGVPTPQYMYSTPSAYPQEMYMGC